MLVLWKVVANAGIKKVNQTLKLICRKLHNYQQVIYIAVIILTTPALNNQSPSYFLKIVVAIWPPNPKVLLMA